MPDQEAPRKPGVLQVAKTLFFVLLMIGKKGTWEEGGDAHRMTTGQIVAGAVIGGIVLVAVLIAVVQLALKLATS
jgi:hypothetical protein